MKLRIIGIPLTAVVIAALVGAPTPTAARAAPSNDDVTNAQRLRQSDFPIRVGLNNARATTDPATDVASTDRSGDPCMGTHSVWYQIRPTRNVRVRLLTTNTYFTTLIGVFKVSAAPPSPVACRAEAPNGTRSNSRVSGVRVRLQAGTRYLVAISACCDPGDGAKGGPTALHIYERQPWSSKIRITRASAGQVSGRVRLTGTYQCPYYTPNINMVVQVRQFHGHDLAAGSDPNDIFFGKRPNRAETNNYLFCNPFKALEFKLGIDSETAFAFTSGHAGVKLRLIVNDGFRDLLRDKTYRVNLEDRKDG